MNKNRTAGIVFIFLVVAGVLSGLWVYGQRQQTKSNNDNIPPERVGSSLASTNKTQVSPTPTAKAKAAAVAQGNGIWTALFGTPIEFFGKVEDEKGLPIGGATVRLSFADTPGGGETNSKLTILTDEIGAFHAEGRGLGVVVMVSKDGYYHLEQSDGRFAYTGAKATVERHSSLSSAAAFVLRKVTKAETLTKVDRSYLIRKDGVPVGVDLGTGHVADSDQLFVVESWTNDAGHQVNSNEPYDWRCRVSVPGGGLMQRNDVFGFVAPATGYRPADDIEMPGRAGARWRSQVERDYFVKFKSGNYGRVTFTMVAGGDHFFLVRSFLNPSGGQNLEAGPPGLGEPP